MDLFNPVGTEKRVVQDIPVVKETNNSGFGIDLDDIFAEALITPSPMTRGSSTILVDLDSLLAAPLPEALRPSELEALVEDLSEVPVQLATAADATGFAAALANVLDDDEIDLLDEVRTDETAESSRAVSENLPASAVAVPLSYEIARGSSGDTTTETIDRDNGRLDVVADHLADSAHDHVDQVRQLARTLLTSLRARVPESEAATHYDLGVALLQMSMYPEAVEEFQIAFRAPQTRIRAFEGLVESLIGQGTARLAYALLKNVGPELPEGPAQQSAQYWMARAAELMNRRDEALAMYEDLAMSDAVFRDVAQRLERLSIS